MVYALLVDVVCADISYPHDISEGTKILGVYSTEEKAKDVAMAHIVENGDEEFIVKSDEPGIVCSRLLAYGEKAGMQEQVVTRLYWEEFTMDEVNLYAGYRRYRNG